MSIWTKKDANNVRKRVQINEEEVYAKTYKKGAALKGAVTSWRRRRMSAAIYSDSMTLALHTMRTRDGLEFELTLCQATVGKEKIVTLVEQIDFQEAWEYAQFMAGGSDE